MLETLTILKAAMPASLRAISKLVNCSRCLPVPLVKNISLAINNVDVPSLSGTRRGQPVADPNRMSGTFFTRVAWVLPS